MKFNLTFKLAGDLESTLDQALFDANNDLFQQENVKNDLQKLLKGYLSWGDVLSVEFDTETGEAKVLKE